jgi:glucose/arabinose dehydrogenase
VVAAVAALALTASSLGPSGPAGAEAASAPSAGREAGPAPSAGREAGPAPAVGREPAGAASVGSRPVVPCRASNPTCWPTAFDFASDGRVFYAERLTGQVRTRDLRTGADRLWARVRGVATAGEQGLLGLALDPGWPRRPWVYLYYTRARPLRNLLVRMRRRADGTLQTQVLASVPAATFHNGGAIAFGPDGMLYAVTGDAGDPSRSQDTSSAAGKVLRMTRWGGVPADNPFGNRVFSYGHRNSFGLAFDPRTGRLWQTENGPECNDEVNRIRRGRNFGWGPRSSCPDTNASGPDPVPPAWLYRRVIAPTGAAFCEACGLGAATRGALLVGAWNDGRIRRLTLTSDRLGVTSSTVLYDHPSGVLALRAGPRGAIHFSAPEGIYRLVSG